MSRFASSQSVTKISPIELSFEDLRTRSKQPSRRYRDHLPTLRDFDPLRHDIGYRRERDASRDSMPTVPDLDPLKHDHSR